MEAVVAELAPSEDRLERFQRLAAIELSREETFKKWAADKELSEEETKQARRGWYGLWDSFMLGNLFGCLRDIAVLDESFRLPQLNAGTDEFRGNVEQKFSKLMLRTSLLALTIQKSLEVTDGTIHPISERHN